jgi:predicted PurR-regulated permease PerM
MSTAWSRSTKYLVGVALILLGIYVLYLSSSVIPLLVVAALIAVAVNPVIRLLHLRLRLPQGVAVAITYLLVLLLLPLLGMLALTAIGQALRFVFSIDYAGLITGFTSWLRTTLENLKAWHIPIGSLDRYVDGFADSLLQGLSGVGPAVSPSFPSLGELAGQLGSALTVTFGAVAGMIGNIFSSAILFIFVFLSAIYLTQSAASYRDAMVRMLPAFYQPEVVELLRRIGKVWMAFFKGQVLLMVIIGVICWAGLALLGVPGALSLGIIAGLLEIVPNLGPIVATIPAVVVALLQGSTHLPVNNLVLALIVIAFYVVVQQLENSFIVPKVLGGAVELPALVVMTGVMVGGTVAGILGALLATPVIATAREILSYCYRKLLDEPPFPSEPTPAAQATPEQQQAGRVDTRQPEQARSARPQPSGERGES